MLNCCILFLTYSFASRKVVNSHIQEGGILKLSVVLKAIPSDQNDVNSPVSDPNVLMLGSSHPEDQKLNIKTDNKQNYGMFPFLACIGGTSKTTLLHPSDKEVEYKSVGTRVGERLEKNDGCTAGGCFYIPRKIEEKEKKAKDSKGRVKTGIAAARKNKHKTDNDGCIGEKSQSKGRRSQSLQVVHRL